MKCYKQIAFGCLILLCTVLGCGNSQSPVSTQPPPITGLPPVPAANRCESVIHDEETILQRGSVEVLSSILSDYYGQLAFDPDFSGEAVDFNCEEGGTAQIEIIRLARERDERAGNFEGTIKVALNDCQESADLSVPSPQNPDTKIYCPFSILPISGEMTCRLRGAYYWPDCSWEEEEWCECPGPGCSEYYYEFVCSSVDTCSGITMLEEEEDHDLGLSIRFGYWFCGDVDCENYQQGSLCVDGTVSDIDEGYDRYHIID